MTAGFWASQKPPSMGKTLRAARRLSTHAFMLLACHAVASRAWSSTMRCDGGGSSSCTAQRVAAVFDVDATSGDVRLLHLAHFTRAAARVGMSWPIGRAGVWPHSVTVSAVGTDVAEAGACAAQFEQHDAVDNADRASMPTVLWQMGARGRTAALEDAWGMFRLLEPLGVLHRAGGDGAAGDDERRLAPLISVHVLAPADESPATSALEELLPVRVVRARPIEGEATVCYSKARMAPPEAHLTLATEESRASLRRFSEFVRARLGNDGVYARRRPATRVLVLQAAGSVADESGVAAALGVAAAEQQLDGSEAEVVRHGDGDSLRDFASSLDRAALLVGVHGDALATAMALLPPGAAVVELVPDAVSVPSFAPMAAALGLLHTVVEARPDEAESNAAFDHAVVGLPAGVTLSEADEAAARSGAALAALTPAVRAACESGASAGCDHAGWVAERAWLDRAMQVDAQRLSRAAAQLLLERRVAAERAREQDALEQDAAATPPESGPKVEAASQPDDTPNLRARPADDADEPNLPLEFPWEVVDDEANAVVGDIADRTPPSGSPDDFAVLGAERSAAARLNATRGDEDDLLGELEVLTVLVVLLVSLCAFGVLNEARKTVGKAVKMD